MAHPASFVYKLVKYVEDYEDLKIADGGFVFCVACNKPILNIRCRADCERHISSDSHQRRKLNVPIFKEFLYDICFTLCAIWGSFKPLRTEEFINFFDRYSLEWQLPSESYMRQHILPQVYATVFGYIRDTVKDTYLWVSVEENAGLKKQAVINVTLKTLDPMTRTPPFLVASKRISRTTPSGLQLIVENIVCTALSNLGVKPKNVLMLVTNASPCMTEAAVSLKRTYPNMIHVTCVAQALYNVTEEIVNEFPTAKHLICRTKQMFDKTSPLKNEFIKKFPGIPLPPRDLHTQRTNWLEALEYYIKYFVELKKFVQDLDPQNSKKFRTVQIRFERENTYKDLCYIHNKFYVVSHAITQLKESALVLSLEESVRIINDVKSAFEDFSDIEGITVSKKLDNVLGNNNGYQFLSNIVSSTSSNCEGPPVIHCDYFRMAPLTSIDVERTFSAYKQVYNRNSNSKICASNAERLLVVASYANAFPRLPSDVPIITDVRLSKIGKLGNFS